MQLFYTADFNDHTFSLEGDEHRHCTKVLRKRIGDSIIASDGNGSELHGIIHEIHRHQTVLNIAKVVKHPRKFGKRVIAIGPTKNTSRFEWFIEKATEIGIDEIAPILCMHAERKVLKMERCEKIAISAAKQSLQFYTPQITTLEDLKSVLERYQSFSHKFIAYVPENEEVLDSNASINEDSVVFIGPEGGFSQEEINYALELGYTSISLGPNRLRTETAGLVACHIINLRNE